jgi:hypothetical protein
MTILATVCSAAGHKTSKYIGRLQHNILRTLSKSPVDLYSAALETGSLSP